MNTSNLRNLLELYEMKDETTVLNQINRVPVKIKNIWGNIQSPKGSNTIIEGELQTTIISVSIQVRKLSIKNPSIDMFFKFPNGCCRYEIKNFHVDYKDNAYWIFNCEVVYE